MLSFHYNSAPSTNDDAARLARLNPATPLLVTAVTQTAGRGRRGRTWQSPPGGAWFTLAWPLHADPAAYQPAPLVVGLALAQAIDHATGAAAQIKWPNDVLLGGAKVAGVLCEMALTGRAARTLIVGVGVNVAVDRDALPGPLQHPATSLHHHAATPPRVPDFIAAAAPRLAAALQHLEAHGLDAPTRAALDARLAWRGQRVHAGIADRRLEGTVTGIDDRGRLVLDTPTGAVPLLSGEVTRVQPANACPLSPRERAGVRGNHPTPPAPPPASPPATPPVTPDRPDPATRAPRTSRPDTIVTHSCCEKR